MVVAEKIYTWLFPREQLQKTCTPARCLQIYKTMVTNGWRLLVVVEDVEITSS